MIQLLLLIEGILFGAAALVHGGILAHGFEDQAASIAESTIAIVLIAALGLTQVWPARTRPIGIAAQAFALLGTLLGVFVIAIGVGPRTVLDIVLHATMLAVLVPGLAATVRAPAGVPVSAP
jgi:hypothetical protein